MNPELNKIFKKSKCLTNSEMLLYLSDGYSVNKHLIELHLTDCDMCSAELEGLSYLQNKENLAEITAGLNKNIDSYLYSEKKVIPLTNSQEKNNSYNFKRVFSIAASIILLISVGFLINNLITQPTTNMAEVKIMSDENAITENELINETKKTDAVIDIEEKESDDDIKENITNKINIDKIADNNVSENNYTNKEKTVNIDNEEKTNPKTETEDIVVGANATEELDEQIAEIVEEKEEIKAKEESEANFSNKKTRGGISFGVARKNVNKSIFKKSGLVSYDIGSYKDALVDFEKHLKQNPNDMEIVYKAGISYFKIGKYKKAISKFDIIISENNIKYFEDAKTYKEKALSKIN